MEQSGSMILTEWSTTTTEHTLTDPCWLWADDWWWSEKWNGTKEGNEWVNEWSTLLSSIHFSFITPHSGCNRTLPGCHFPRLTAVIRWKGEWKKKTQTKYQRAKYKWKCVILPFVLLVGLFFIIHFHRSSLFFSPFAPFSLPSLRFSPLKRSERRKKRTQFTTFLSYLLLVVWFLFSICFSWIVMERKHEVKHEFNWSKRKRPTARTSFICFCFVSCFSFKLNTRSLRLLVLIQWKGNKPRNNERT